MAAVAHACLAFHMLTITKQNIYIASASMPNYVLSSEVSFQKQQRINYYCNLNNFVSLKLELCMKALVNISIEFYLIYIVSDYRIKQG